MPLPNEELAQNLMTDLFAVFDNYGIKAFVMPFYFKPEAGTPHMHIVFGNTWGDSAHDMEEMADECMAAFKEWLEGADPTITAESN